MPKNEKRLAYAREKIAAGGSVACVCGQMFFEPEPYAEHVERCDHVKRCEAVRD